MQDAKVIGHFDRSSYFSQKDTGSESYILENIRLRERVSQLEKDIIDVSVEIDSKNSIIDNLQTWKNMLALLNSPQYSEVSVEINKVYRI